MSAALVAADVAEVVVGRRTVGSGTSWQGLDPFAVEKQPFETDPSLFDCKDWQHTLENHLGPAVLEIACLVEAESQCQDKEDTADHCLPKTNFASDCDCHTMLVNPR